MNPKPQKQRGQNEDYTAAATLTQFEKPLPLLRHPVPASPRDSPSKGPYVLAFKDPKSWLTAYASTVSKLTHQCESAARIACSISASNNCTPPWWHRLIGRKPPNLRDCQLCEEREMGECFAASGIKCAEFAKDKCAAAFRDAIVQDVGEVRLKRDDAWRLVWLGSVPVERSMWVGLIGFDELGSRVLSGCEFGVTSYRTGEMFGSEDDVDQILSRCTIKDQELNGLGSGGMDSKR